MKVDRISPHLAPYRHRFREKFLTLAVPGLFLLWEQSQQLCFCAHIWRAPFSCALGRTRFFRPYSLLALRLIDVCRPLGTLSAAAFGACLREEVTDCSSKSRRAGVVDARPLSRRQSVGKVGRGPLFVSFSSVTITFWGRKCVGTMPTTPWKRHFSRGADVSLLSKGLWDIRLIVLESTAVTVSEEIFDRCS